MRCTTAALLLDQVIRQIRRESLAPVAAGIVDVDAITPPVVQDLVGIGRMNDERKPNDPRAQEGERRQAVARLPEILHQRELGVRVWPDESAVEFHVARRGFQVTIGEPALRAQEEGEGSDMPRVPLIDVEAVRGQNHIILGLVLDPADHGSFGTALA